MPSPARPSPRDTRYATGDAYVDILDYLNDHSDSFPWFMVRRHLPEDLAEVCADTLCQGAYHDLSGLGIACSTEAATGTVGSCLWTIAGANLHVTTKGKVSAKTKVFGCPIALQGSADAVLGVLGGPDPLNAPLPGSGTTLMTQLDACLP